MDRCDVAILGAGPYGLSAAAHLQPVKGLDVRLFGETMSFWERHMPAEMGLRSPWAASHISTPENRLSLDVYRELKGNDHLAYPVGVADFIKYGRWICDQVKVPADKRKVTRIEIASSHEYRLALDDGAVVHARRVVVAGGIQPFAHRPDLFAGLPASLVMHTSEQGRSDSFRDKDVLIIGAGQSALEAAGFLNNAGARIEVLIRQSTLHWLGRRQWMHGKAIGWMFYGRGDIGPAGISVLVQHPHLFRRLPRALQERWGARAIRAAVSHRLMPHTRDLPIHLNRSVVEARVQGERLRLRLSDGTDRTVDHVILGTGYRVNIARYPFLPPAVLEQLDMVDGYPRLTTGFETSLPGLHILGAPAAWSFGPLMRFVAGTEFASRALTRRIVLAKRRDRVSSWSASAPRTGPVASDVNAARVTMASQEAGSRVAPTSS
jgi:cation diffusion facilitator CzcD-associated flavoprotein CzcO